MSEDEHVTAVFPVIEAVAGLEDDLVLDAAPVPDNLDGAIDADTGDDSLG